ncbi:MAG: hypothetical protein ACSLFR_12410 [Solirubrobacteraceae bacterium]
MPDRRLASALAAIVLLPAGLSTPRGAETSSAAGCQTERAPATRTFRQ